MKFLVIFALAIIAIADAQFRFSNPFRGFRVPSFRRPSRPRAPRFNTQTFTRPITSSSSNTISRPVSSRPVSSSSSSSSFTSSGPSTSGGNGFFVVRGPSQPGSSSSSSTSFSSVPSSISSSSGGNAIFEIQGPNQPSALSSASSTPVVNAPVFQSAPATALREVVAPDMTAQVASRPSSDSGSNHQWQGRNYVLSWREGRNGFSHSAARSYCRGKGMRIVSLDNIQKAQHFLDLVERNNVPYFWAGGQISSDKRTLTWENGGREGISRGRFPWSTGGSRGPQPDGGPVSENCLAILNNVYNDRVKFHDVGCSHTKPTVCEQ